jgi:hypothetical protein
MRTVAAFPAERKGEAAKRKSVADATAKEPFVLCHLSVTLLFVDSQPETSWPS